MPGVDDVQGSRRREVYEADARVSQPPQDPQKGASEKPQPSRSGPSDADMQRMIDDLPERHFEISPNLFVKQMDTWADRIEEAKRAADTKAKAQLDAVRDRFSGPYKVDGTLVQARPMFRMNGDKAVNAATAKTNNNELVKICKKANVPDSAINNARVGRPTPEQLVQVTQALIDAGKLPRAANDTVEMRIRQMQYKWGIGVDCAGYVREAALAVHGKGAQSLVNGTNRFGAIDNLLQTHAFQTVAISDIRAGDIIYLNPWIPGFAGHSVFVHSHEIATDSMRAELSARDPLLSNFLKGKGPFHVLNVDSSWGAGDGQDYGGFRRDAWIYDESWKMWGYFFQDDAAGKQMFSTSETGPNNEIFKGAFRPSDAK